MLNPRTSRVWWAGSGSSWTTDRAIGSIISDVAVLLTHMLTSAEAIRNPAMIDDGFVPSIPIKPMATRRWRFHRCIASAMMNPPRNRKIIGLANGAAVVVIFPSPSAGNSTSGSNAVAGIGIDSAIQNTAISVATPAVSQPSTLRPEGGGSSSVSSKAAGPTTQPARWRRP